MVSLFVKGRAAILRAWNNEEGASLAEYALLIALILVGVGVAVTLLRDNISAAITAGATELQVQAGPPAP
jgi:Flp pilus assembly pilin Flp